MAGLQEKQLGQLRPANTNAATLYSPPDNTTTIITYITVCNLTGSAVDYAVFCDDDGTTYNSTTALFHKNSVAGDTTDEIKCFVAMNNTSGNLAVRTRTANAINFTAFGTEIS